MKRIALLLLLLLLLTALPARAQEVPAEHQDPAAWETVLLIGADNRSKSTEYGRADAIIVCALNRHTGALRLLSLTRDMWIQLPDSMAHNRINTAYRFGGPDRMLKAVNETLGLSIDKYAAVDFPSFCNLIDMLGGVTVEINRSEALTINKMVEDGHAGSGAQWLSPAEGGTTLCGVQALSYARIRNLDSDFGRTGRQRKLLTAILDKVREKSLTEQIAFVSEALKCVETNLSLADILSLSTIVLAHGLSDFDQLALPTEGNFRYKSIEGMSVVTFDAEVTLRQAQEFIFGSAQ